MLSIYLEMKFHLTPKRRLVLDGAMGTELIERGLSVRADIAERWVLERPNDVIAIHRAYVEAGAEALQTCTFGAVRSRLLPYGLGERVREICEHAVALARSAAGGLPIIASLGPTSLAAPGTMPVEVTHRIESELAESASALANAGIDAIHLETQYAPAELTAAASGIRSATSVPLWISITLTTGPSGLETPHGVPIDRMLKALADAAPDAIGVNCSLDADRIRGAVERLLDSGLGPVVVRPQARMSEKCATGRSSESPARFAERAAALFDLGAVAVGGCCGTRPAAIAALRSMIHGPFARTELSEAAT